MVVGFLSSCLAVLHKISNAAISGLLRFFKAFVHFFSGAYAEINVLEAVPSSAEGALRYLGISKDSSFVIYIVCPKCDSIYNFDDCVLSRGTTKESKLTLTTLKVQDGRNVEACS